MNPLPPQAYTKDTLMKAYAWLMVQSESVREMATTPDILISLYLKINRDGESVLDRPSIQNFKNELKSLAGLMGQLEEPQAQLEPLPLLDPQPQKAQTTFTPQIKTEIKQTTAEATPPVESSSMLPSNSYSFLESLDEQSLAMIQESKNDFNLSSDIETLRMLIKIGYSRAKKML